MFEIKIIDPSLKQLPERATSGAAAYDLRACWWQLGDLPHSPQVNAFYMEPGQKREVRFGVAVHIAEPGHCAIIAPRSGLASHHDIVLANSFGIIDSDYQGELYAYMINRGDDIVWINKHQRVAQLLVLPIATPEWKVVDDFTQASERGEGGFGSTGHY